MELCGRIAIITGAAKRIGAELALGLAQRGVDIALHYSQSDQSAQRVAEQIRAMGRRVALFAADLSQEENAAALPAQVAETLGVATILINNAAIFQEGSLLTTQADQWHRHLAINLTAPFFLMQGFAAQINKCWPIPDDQVKGKVINLVDQRIIHPRPGHLAYTVAKSGLMTLTTLCAQELAPAILVNAIGPGAILPANPDDPNSFHKIAAASPIGKAGGVRDVLDATLFLLAQDYVTGQVIHVDGGKHLI